MGTSRASGPTASGSPQSSMTVELVMAKVPAGARMRGHRCYRRCRLYSSALTCASTRDAVGPPEQRTPGRVNGQKRND